MAVSTFEGLPTGAVTATAAGFDAITNPSGGGPQIIATNPFRGSRALSLTTGTGGGTCYAERSISLGVTSAGTLFGRCRVRVPVLPADATGMRLLVVADSANGFVAEARIINTGRVQLRSGAGTLLATSTAVYTADQWVDVGLAVLAFSTTVGQIQARLWDTATGAVAETLTSTATLNTVGAGGLNRAQVGALRSGVASYTVVVDDVDWAVGDYPTLVVDNPSAANLSGSSGLTATGVVTAAGSAALSAASALAAAPTRGTTASSALSAATGLTATAYSTTSGVAELAAASALSATPVVAAAASADMSSATTFTAVGRVQAGGEATLGAVSGLAAEGTRTLSATVAFHVTSGLTAAATVTRPRRPGRLAAGTRRPALVAATSRPALDAGIGEV